MPQLPTAVRRWLPLGLLGIVLVAALAVAAGRHGPETEAQRVQRVAKEVRCPQCEGLSAAESDAPAAQAVRQAIADRIEQGESDGQIKAFLADKYGQDILLKPPASGISGLVWALPVVAFLAAAIWLGFVFGRWRRRTLAHPSEEDEVLVARARRKRSS